MALYSYILYREKNSEQGPRVGHLDGEEISPLSWPSGTYVTSLYDVVSAGHHDFIITPGSKPIGLDKVQVLAPFAERNVLAVGKNYVEHAKEFVTKIAYDMGAKDLDPLPTHPVIFNKKRTSIIASGDEVYLNPDFTQTVDYEGEIGVIIGKTAYNVNKEDALDYVWGYTLINDVSARERQRQHQQYFVGKSLDGFSPMGPVAVAKDKFSKDETIKFTTKVNGQVRQKGDTSQLIFSIPDIIETLSAGFTLEAGDVIASGTPAGVGGAMDPPTFLRDGDIVEVEAEKIGKLSNKFVGKREVVATQVGNSESEEQVYVDTIGEEDFPAVVFIHGIGETSAVFRPTIDKAKLYDRHRVVLYDLEGHGKSSTVPSSVVTIDSLVADLKSLFSQLGLKKASLVGHSIGSVIAGRFAEENPQLIDKVILAGVPSLEAGTRERLGSLAQEIRARGGETEVAIAKSLHNSAPADVVEQLVALEFQRALLRQSDGEGVAKLVDALVDNRIGSPSVNYDKLSSSSILIVQGTTDLVVPYGGAHDDVKVGNGKVVQVDPGREGSQIFLASVEQAAKLLEWID